MVVWSDIGKRWRKAVEVVNCPEVEVGGDC